MNPESGRAVRATGAEDPRMVDNARRLMARYRLVRKIAAGGMGTVHAAIDDRLDRPVAVKILEPRLADDPTFIERFKREARAAAALSHPNIANVFDFGEDGSDHFMVMELVEGADLAQVLHEQGPLRPDRAMRIAAQICAALDHAHAAGLVHRDVKPANVIVGPGDHVKVTDFGIARAVGEARLTASGTVMGTARYISPEQASGAAVGPASDVYSTGIVLFEMLTGEVPFTGESPLAVAMSHVTGEVPSPRALNLGVPGALDAIVARATAKEPRARFHSAGALQAALDATATAAIGGDPLSTKIPAVAGDRPRGLLGSHSKNLGVGGRTKLVFGLLAIIAVALLVAGIAGGETPAPRADTVTDRSKTADPGFTMPRNASGLSANALRDVLESEGLEVEIEKIDPDDLGLDLDEDLVATTDPPPGEAVGNGDTIVLYVSTGGDDDDDNDHDDNDDDDSDDNTDDIGDDDDED
jgi:eukaryotic-like serine/threonine-protein kinase